MLNDLFKRPRHLVQQINCVERKLKPFKRAFRSLLKSIRNDAKCSVVSNEPWKFAKNMN